MTRETTIGVNWKDSSPCLGLNCECGAHGHHHDYFGYNLICEGCGAVYQLASQIPFVRIDPENWPEIEHVFGAFTNDLTLVSDCTYADASRAMELGYEGLDRLTDLGKPYAEAKRIWDAAAWLRREYPDEAKTAR